MTEQVAALIVAAGRGTRAAGAGHGPKQYAILAGQSVLSYSIAQFERHPSIHCVQVVIHADDEASYEQALAARFEKLLPPVIGGATRQASVLAGIEALAERKTVTAVLVHDAARPLVSADDVSRLIAALDGADGAILAAPVSDTLKRAAVGAGVPVITETVRRDGLWRAMTPQAFRLAPLLAAHRAATRRDDMAFTDDAAIFEAAGAEAQIVAGRTDNLKITTPEDFDMAARLLRPAVPDVRTGNGFDVHRFGPGDAVWLCGVKISHDEALTGHSDADVGLHALTDAVLGAIGAGDIGAHFPPTEARWKGAASDQFLAHAVALARQAGGMLTHVDVTLVCEAPKVGPHRDAMRARIAEICGIDETRVSVKATTTEGLGFTGRREGIAAQATATVVLSGSQIVMQAPHSNRC